MEAVIRASDVTTPSLIGTLRSARMNTRLFLRLRSVSLMTDIAYPNVSGEKNNLGTVGYTLILVRVWKTREEIGCVSHLKTSCPTLLTMELFGSDTCHLKNRSGIAPFIIIPSDNLNKILVQGHASSRVKNRGTAFTPKVSGNDLLIGIA